MPGLELDLGEEVSLEGEAGRSGINGSGTICSIPSWAPCSLLSRLWIDIAMCEDWIGGLEKKSFRHCRVLYAAIAEARDF